MPTKRRRVVAEPEQPPRPLLPAPPTWAVLRRPDRWWSAAARARRAGSARRANQQEGVAPDQWLKPDPGASSHIAQHQCAGARRSCSSRRPHAVAGGDRRPCWRPRRFDGDDTSSAVHRGSRSRTTPARFCWPGGRALAIRSTGTPAPGQVHLSAGGEPRDVGDRRIGEPKGRPAARVLAVEAVMGRLATSETS